MQKLNVNTWNEFEEGLKTVRDRSAKGRFLFRGQANSGWSLDTTLERDEQKEMLFREYYEIISAAQSQIETFTGKTWVIPSVADVYELTKNYDQFSGLTFGRFPAYSYMAICAIMAFHHPSSTGLIRPTSLLTLRLGNQLKEP